MFSVFDGIAKVRFGGQRHANAPFYQIMPNGPSKVCTTQLFLQESRTMPVSSCPQQQWVLAIYLRLYNLIWEKGILLSLPHSFITSVVECLLGDFHRSEDFKPIGRRILPLRDWLFSSALLDLIEYELFVLRCKCFPSTSLPLVFEFRLLCFLLGQSL